MVFWQHCLGGSNSQGAPVRPPTPLGNCWFSPLSNLWPLIPSPHWPQVTDPPGWDFQFHHPNLGHTRSAKVEVSRSQYVAVHADAKWHRSSSNGKSRWGVDGAHAWGRSTRARRMTLRRSICVPTEKRISYSHAVNGSQGNGTWNAVHPKTTMEAAVDVLFHKCFLLKWMVESLLCYENILGMHRFRQHDHKKEYWQPVKSIRIYRQDIAVKMKTN